MKLQQNMNNKELKITAPEGYEIDQEKSSFEKIVFKKIEKSEPKIYEEVAELSIRGKNGFYIGSSGTVQPLYKIDASTYNPNIARTKAQLEWILALNKLQNVASYLNDGWVPDWQNKRWDKHYLYYSNEDHTIKVSSNRTMQCSVVYFKSEQLAKKAIDILGEEEVKKALGVYKGC